ncbi:MAG: hypothetical protein WCC22_03930 [Terriglobales bacterium]
MNNMDMLVKHMLDLHDAIEESYEKARYMPCLVLLYSGIDVAASLEPKLGTGVGDRFKKWVNRYMLKSGSLKCTASDLCGARCAVVHTFTPESDLSKGGKARVIGYAFGVAELDKLDKASNIAAQSRQVNVHARSLIDAFYEGFGTYLEEVRGDRVRLQEIERTAGLWAVSMNPKTIDDYLEIQKRLMGPQTP